MSMDLKTELIHKKPRENSGSKSGNRFDYQKNWAICKVLELQLSEDNFVIILDFHDDIALINDDKNPDEINFFQIKTKETNHWNISDLIRYKEDKNSILGKMYLNKISFPMHTKSLNFVSNSYCNVELSNESQTF